MILIVAITVVVAIVINALQDKAIVWLEFDTVERY